MGQPQATTHRPHHPAALTPPTGQPAPIGATSPAGAAHPAAARPPLTPEMTVTIASLVGREHLGATVTIQPPDPTAPEQLTITGVLRWITHTSDSVLLAVEEDGDDGDGAVEWEMPLGALVRVEARRAER